MYATGSPFPRRRTSSRIDVSSAASRGRSNCRYRSMRRSPSACAQSSSESRRAEGLPWSPRYVVLRRSTSMSVGGAGATSGSVPRRGITGLVLEEPARLVLVRQRLDEQVEIAVEHPLELMHREVDAMVGHARLREVVCANLLAAVAAPHHRPARRFQLRVALRLREVEEARAQHAHRLGTIFDLRLLVL